MAGEETLQDVQQEVLHEIFNGVRTNNDSDNAGNCCVICLSEITEPCVAVPCSHRNFDFICLATWLQSSSCCPLCKTELTELHYDLGDAHEEGKVYKVNKLSGSTLFPHHLHAIPGSAGSSQQRQQDAGRERRRDQSSASPQQSLRIRRHIYRHQLYSLHVGSNPSTQYKEWTRDDMIEGSEMLGRARAWIRRELLVFGHLHHGEDDVDGGNSFLELVPRRARHKNAAFVLEYVVAVLKTVDLQASNGHAGTLLADFLGKDNALLFLHELRNFLRSPYSVDGWDRHVQYSEPRQRFGSRVEATGLSGESQAQMQDLRSHTQQPPPSGHNFNQNILRVNEYQTGRRRGWREADRWRPRGR
ncbi:hypothetical protein BD289DRAFT_368703 [Coniella lustricola]|uniref:RING-type E3 ubiquitin transferase n=1 Tax=Coniella lustricola TaxID=2025994 RepID=A0A2T3A7Q8_9PEZI|nr:hypothetical protein BD289DRAFT_368703 [Coniella lustricola]